MISKATQLVSELGQMIRPWRVPARQESEDVHHFEGRIILEPPDAFTDGRIILDGVEDHGVELVDHLYDRLEVPREDDLLPHASFYVRVRLEVLDDPDLQWIE